MNFLKLSGDSHDSISEQLDLFNVPPTKTSVLEGEVIELGPVREPFGDGPIEFEIDGNTDHYIDLNNTLLHVQCKIKKQNGDLLDEDEEKVKISPTNLLLHSMFQSMSITINGKQIEHETNYAHKSFLTTALNYGKAAKSTHLASSLWIDDDMGEEHTANLAARQKTKIKTRAAAIAKSKTLDMVGRLNSPLFHQTRYLIPGLNIHLKLQRHNTNFVLQKTEDDEESYKIDITKIELLVRKVKIHPSIVTSHNKLLSQGKKVQYPINDTDTQFFTITPGRQNERINILQNKQEAKIIIVGLTSHTAKHGSYMHSPFKFEHFNISSINLNVNGRNILNKPLHLSFSEDIYTRAYHNLQAVCDKTFANEGNDIKLKDYKSGLCLFAFDNTPDQCRGEGLHLTRNSTTILELTFAQPVAETVSVLVYTEFDDLLEIDQTRVVTRSSSA